MWTLPVARMIQVSVLMSSMTHAPLSFTPTGECAAARYSNRRLFLDYGFTIPNQWALPHDSVILNDWTMVDPTDLSQELPLQALRDMSESYDTTMDQDLAHLDDLEEGGGGGRNLDLLRIRVQERRVLQSLIESPSN